MRKRPIHWVAAVSLLAAAAAITAQEKPPAAPAQVAIKAGRLLDVRTGRYIPNAVIFVEGDRIARIETSAPRDVRLIDLSKATVLPGLVDAHAHVLGNMKDWSWASGLRMSSAQSALWGAHNLRIWLDHGFTSLRNAGEFDLGYGQFALRDSVKMGLIPGPRMVCSGSFISVTGGHGDADVLAPDQALGRRPNIADTVDEVSIAVRRDIKYGADWIKLMATGGVMDPISDYRTQELSEEQMARAVEVAHRAGKFVMAHAEGTDGIKAAIRAGVDSIEHGSMLDEEGVRMMAEKGTWLVPTINSFYRTAEEGEAYGMDAVSIAKNKAILPMIQDAFQRALKHHLKFAYGVDDDPDFVSKEFGALVRGGMTTLGAIQAATVNAAELLRMAKEIGTIEPGKFADLVAVDGDPLVDIGAMERVLFVMKGGEVVKSVRSTGASEPASRGATEREPVSRAGSENQEGKTAEQERLELEQEWNRADLNDDWAPMDRILADDYVLTDRDGEVFTKGQCRAFYGSGESKVLALASDDMKVRVYGDAAVVTMRARIKEAYKGQETSDVLRITNTWIKKAGRWQCVATHSSRIAQ